MRKAAGDSVGARVAQLALDEIGDKPTGSALKTELRALLEVKKLARRNTNGLMSSKAEATAAAGDFENGDADDPQSMETPR